MEKQLVYNFFTRRQHKSPLLSRILWLDYLLWMNRPCNIFWAIQMAVLFIFTFAVTILCEQPAYILVKIFSAVLAIGILAHGVPYVIASIWGLDYMTQIQIHGAPTFPRVSHETLPVEMQLVYAAARQSTSKVEVLKPEPDIGEMPEGFLQVCESTSQTHRTCIKIEEDIPLVVLQREIRLQISSREDLQTAI